MTPKPTGTAIPDTRAQVLRLCRQKAYQLPSGAANKSLLARTLKVTRTRIQQILAGPDKKVPAPPPALHGQILGLLDEVPPLSREEIAHRVGCHPQTITRIAALYGAGRGRGRPSNRGRSEG